MNHPFLQFDLNFYQGITREADTNRYLQYKDDIDWLPLYTLYLDRKLPSIPVVEIKIGMYKTAKALFNYLNGAVQRNTPTVFYVSSQISYHTTQFFLSEITEEGFSTPLFSIMYHKNYEQDHIASIITCGKMLPEYLQLHYSPILNNYSSPTLQKHFNIFKKEAEKAGIKSYESDLDWYKPVTDSDEGMLTTKILAEKLINELYE